MWKLDHKENWAPRNLCFWNVDCKEVNLVNPKGNQSWTFIGRTDVEGETPILWPLDVMNWLIGKDLDDGKDWSQEQKGTTDDDIVGWHHQLHGHEFEQAVGELMNKKAWHSSVHEVAKSWTQLSPELNLSTIQDKTDMFNSAVVTAWR